MSGKGNCSFRGLISACGGQGALYLSYFRVWMCGKRLGSPLCGTSKIHCYISITLLPYGLIYGEKHIWFQQLYSPDNGITTRCTPVHGAVHKLHAQSCGPEGSYLRLVSSDNLQVHNICEIPERGRVRRITSFSSSFQLNHSPVVLEYSTLY